MLSRDLCLLSAYGTAAIFDCPSPNHPPPPMSAPVTEDMIAKVAEKSVNIFFQGSPVGVLMYIRVLD